MPNVNVLTRDFNMSGTDEGDVVGCIIPMETNCNAQNYCVATEFREAINVGRGW